MDKSRSFLFFLGSSASGLAQFDQMPAYPQTRTPIFPIHDSEIRESEMNRPHRDSFFLDSGVVFLNRTSVFPKSGMNRRVSSQLWATRLRFTRMRSPNNRIIPAK